MALPCITTEMGGGNSYAITSALRFEDGPSKFLDSPESSQQRPGGQRFRNDTGILLNFRGVAGNIFATEQIEEKSRTFRFVL